MKLLRWGFWSWLLWRLFGPIIKPPFKPPQEHPWRLAGRTVFAGDEEFVVREDGPVAADPILLIHGLSGSSLGEWYQVGPKLATERRVIMIDHRNHGLAPQASDPYRIEDVADDIAAVLDRMGVASLDVVGYSMGGAIAQALAHRHPGRVKKLVLIATLAAHPEGTRWARQIGVVLTRAWERFTGTGTPDVRAGYLLATGAVERRHARWLWEENHRRNTDSGAQASFAMLRFDSKPWISRLDVEALVIIPTDDLLVPPAWQYELAALLPRAGVVEVVGARHELVWSHSDRVLDEIRAFVG
jgi:pimeloyl-ACP methyl ester carboxylesterase